MDEQIIADILRIFKESVVWSYSQKRAILTYNGQQKTVNGPRQSPGNAIATGRLVNSIEVEIVQNFENGNPTIYVGPPPGSEEYFYSYFLENGRKPSIGRMPPLDKISIWAKSKRGLYSRDRQGRFRRVSDEAKVFLIRRSIAQYGFAGYPFFDRAVERALPKITDELGDLAANYFRGLLNNIN